MGYMSELDIIIGNLAEAFVKQHGLKEDTVPLIAKAMSAGATAALSFISQTADDDAGSLRPCRTCGGQFTGPGEVCPACGGK